jgi:glutamyl-tRNA synthetase
MSEKPVRVRFAPSPTGPLHIGGVRTALYNYLFAKKHGGTMILRIEDTDQTRFVPGAEEYIMDAFDWCGIQFDEGIIQGGKYGPYRQSDRKELYRQYAQQLIDSHNAYYAFDSAEELDALRNSHEAEGKTFTYSADNRGGLNNSENIGLEAALQKIEAGNPYVIRFRTQANETLEMQDIIRGDIRVQTDTLDDKILFKSDGMPTYHLANIVDDHLMEITHVIRGEEWLPSMPLHILLYKAFGWQPPQFAHLPLLLKPKGNGKLSKRDGDKLGFPVFPTQWVNPETNEKSMGYREEGYFAPAFINMLALLGWNSGTEQEVFSMEELIQSFSLERVNKSGARFDPDKAKWFNHQYMLTTSNEDIAVDFKKFLDDKGVDSAKMNLLRIVELVKERAHFVSELWEQSSFFFEAPTEYDAKASKKNWKEDTSALMTKLSEILSSIDDFRSANIEEIVKEWIQSNDIPIGKVMNAFRLSVVGAGKGPHMFDIIDVIGKTETINRISQAIKTLN